MLCDKAAVNSIHKYVHGDVEEEQGRTKGGTRMIEIFIFDMQISSKLSISLLKRKKRTQKRGRIKNGNIKKEVKVRSQMNTIALHSVKESIKKYKITKKKSCIYRNMELM